MDLGQRNRYSESLQAGRFWARIPAMSRNFPFPITVHTGFEAKPFSSAMDTMAFSGSEAVDTTPYSAPPPLHGKLWGGTLPLPARIRKMKASISYSFILRHFL